MLLATWSAATPAVSQARPGAADAPATPPKYDHPEEIAALDVVVQSLGQAPEAVVPAPEDLVELSRLLSSPCDQLRWLAAQAQGLAGQPAQRQAAQELAQAAGRRGEQLAGQGLLTDCADLLAAFAGLAKREEPLEGETNPDALRARLEQIQGPLQLDPPGRFVLLSRGAPSGRVVAGAKPEDWDMPRIVVDGLAGGVELPALAKLLKLQMDLITAYQAWGQTAAFGTPEQRQAVGVSFQIAAALLDRALGLDAQDLAGVAQPIPYQGGAEAWSAAAAALDSGGLWSWATLAHLLAASPPAGKAATPESIAAVRDPLDKLRKVNSDPKVWPALADAENGWIARLGNPARLTPGRMLPLAQDFRASDHDRRRAAEQQAVPKLGGGSAAAQAIDEVLRSIQLAKAADVGAEVVPLGLDDLKRALGGAQPWVYLFVEVLELRETAAAGGARYCGVAVYRTKYEKPLQNVAYDDRYEAKIIPLKPSLEEVVREALAAPGPPREGDKIRKDARIIIAPDGPPAASWFAFERSELLEPTNWSSTDASWVVYLPSAAALSAPQWTLESTLQTWYRAGLRQGLGGQAKAWPPATWQNVPRTLTKAVAGSPVDNESIVVYSIALESGRTDRTSAASRLPDFLADKRRQDLPAVALCVNKGARRGTP